MATVATKPLTAEEFFEWVHRPENRDRYFELERGQIIEMPPPTKFHGFVCGNSAWILRTFAERRRKGYVCTNDSGVIVERDPDTVRGPDLTFYEDHQSADKIERAYAVVPPRVAIEVRHGSRAGNRSRRTDLQSVQVRTDGLQIRPTASVTRDHPLLNHARSPVAE